MDILKWEVLCILYIRMVVVYCTLEGLCKMYGWMVNVYGIVGLVYIIRQILHI